MQLKTPLWQEAEWVCQSRARKKGRRYRGLRPLAEDATALLQAVNRLEFAVAGFKNRDMRALLYPHETSAQKLRRQTAALGRRLALLRAHGLIRKVPGRHSIR